MTLVFVDDERALELAPFSLTRPACELRAGAELVRRRWELALAAQTTGFIGAPQLDSFEEPGAAHRANGRLAAGTILVNSRCAVDLANAATADVWHCDGRIAAVRLAEGMEVDDVRANTLETLAGDRPFASVGGQWLDNVWDLVRTLPALLELDIASLATRLDVTVPAEVTKLGSHALHVERGATIEPHVVVDASAGSVLVRRGAVIQSFTRLVGPCVIGEDAIVSGGRIAASSIGERSRVAGEVSTTIFIGHANKAHDGFIGHSVLGRWVNLGASTVNSNLKNTYGNVSLWTPRGVEDTGLQFLGTFFGDHAKTAIGTRLNTGTVVGAGANVFGGSLPGKHVVPFAWGTEGARHWKLDAFLVTAERVMRRREVTLTENIRRQLTAAWTASTQGGA